jgi:hypothetical protein
VSLVSVAAGNWCYSCKTVERVERCETVEIAGTDVVFMQVAENMLGYQIGRDEYPTLSAITSILLDLRAHH